MNQLLEFLTNPEFVRWVKDPDEDLELYWSTWIKANPSKVPNLKMAREIILGIRVEEKRPEFDFKDEVLNNILQEDRVSENKTQGKLSDGEFVSKNTQWFGQYYRVAAIISICVLLAFLYGTATKLIIPEAINSPIHKVADKGERMTFKLPDGSVVWLNSGSELSYPEQFLGDERRVVLEGEGFFEVAHDPQKPFRVQSSELVTTALGTSFNINNYKKENLQIALITGKVEVENLLTKAKNNLTPGQLLDYSPGSQETIIGPFEVREITGWKKGVLIFKEASFIDVMNSLEKWYGVEIEVLGAPSREWNIDISFENTGLERVLKRMAYIEDFEFEIKGKSVIIKF
ncbi:FecR domain-containing protein [Echinicola sediminis]